jgi:Asp-tRNA(Asn)/Glu-tRNA(Gln) amidotransferase A subunit family amidase
MQTQGQARTSLWERGAGELAAAISAGEVSSREVVAAHLARIEAVNPVVNALHAAAEVETALGTITPIDPRTP